MIFTQTRDFDLVHQIVTHPKLYPWLSDDFSPSAEEYSPVDHASVRYVLVHDDRGLLCGLFMFVSHSPVLWEVHTCLLPSSWGDTARQAAREVAEWVWHNSGCQRIVTQVPEYNRLARRLALAAGMTEYGRNPRCFQKRQQLHDEILLGLSRPTTEEPCPQQ